MREVYQKVLKEIYPFSWQNKWLIARSKFTPTSEKISKKGYQGNAYEQIFRPSKIWKYFMLLMCIFLCGAIGWLYFFQENLRNNPIGLLLVIPLILAIWLVWYVFKDPSVNYILRISRMGIQLNETLYTWERIDETVTLFVHHGKSSTHYLIIILKDGQFFRVNISSVGMLWGTATTVSTAVEHFKRAALQRA